MSRTYRKYPHGVNLHHAPERDGTEWYAPKSTMRHVKQTTNRLSRREWLSNRELRKERARLNLALT